MKMRGPKPIYAFILLVLLLAPAHSQALDASEIHVGASLRDVAVAPGSDVAYGTDMDDMSVIVVDINKGTVIKKVLINETPRGIAVNPANNNALVTAVDHEGMGHLFVITPDGTIEDVLDIGGDPQGITVSHSTGTLLIAMEKQRRLLLLSMFDYSIKGEVRLPARPRFVEVDSGSYRAVVVAGNSRGQGMQNRIIIADIYTGEIKKEARAPRDLIGMTLINTTCKEKRIHTRYKYRKHKRDNGVHRLLAAWFDNAQPLNGHRRCGGKAGPCAP
jgi:hypothetical protein